MKKNYKKYCITKVLLRKIIYVGMFDITKIKENVVIVIICYFIFLYDGFSQEPNLKKKSIPYKINLIFICNFRIKRI